MTCARILSLIALLATTHVSAPLLGPFLAAPAIANDRPPVVNVDIGALTVDSDFAVFMGKEVPEEVRRAALRRLWVLMQQPVSCDELCYEPHPVAELFASREPIATVAAR